MKIIAPVPSRRLAFGLLLEGVVLAGSSSSRVVHQSRDLACSSPCIPPEWEVGDLNYDAFYARGIYGIALADLANDPHGLDGYNDVDDAIGCVGQERALASRLVRQPRVLGPAATYGRCVPPGPLPPAPPKNHLGRELP